jgi:hypothetical protein
MEEGGGEGEERSTLKYKRIDNNTPRSTRRGDPRWGRRKEEGKEKGGERNGGKREGGGRKKAVP